MTTHTTTEELWAKRQFGIKLAKMLLEAVELGFVFGATGSLRSATTPETAANYILSHLPEPIVVERATATWNKEDELVIICTLANIGEADITVGVELCQLNKPIPCLDLAFSKVPVGGTIDMEFVVTDGTFYYHNDIDIMVIHGQVNTPYKAIEVEIPGKTAATS